MTAPQLGFWPLAEEAPAHLALVACGEGGEERDRQTAGELLAASNRLVDGLRALGLGRGDAVATLLGNEPAMVELLLAVSQAGFYLTPINIHLAAPEVAHILGDCGARALVCSPRFAETARRAADECQLPAGSRFATGPAEGFRSFEELKAGRPETAPSDRVAGLVMNYTSGTTGRPRGVRRPLMPIAPEALGSSYAQFLTLFGITPQGSGVHLVVAPLYHTAVLNFCTYHLHMGHTVVVMERFEPETMLRLVERYRVTASHMVPTHFNRLLSLPEAARRRYDLSSLSHVIHSAAPCPVPTKQRMLDWWGPVIYEYYAASEGGGTLATPADWLAHPGTVGRPWPISEIRILDDEGTPASARAHGTVYIRMGQHKFEYHKDEGKTRSAWKDGFFTVGDAGYLDEEGFLYLCDRKSDMIISGGVNIYPAEIESVLLQHPAVADAAVFGIPDEDWGESVKAVIELQPGSKPGAKVSEDILSFCRERLAGYKLPRSIDFTRKLPRDPNGKLYKRRLRDPYWAGRERQI
jgi:long-chain acyl-CoA synthetase